MQLMRLVMTRYVATALHDEPGVTPLSDTQELLFLGSIELTRQEATLILLSIDSFTDLFASGLMEIRPQSPPPSGPTSPTSQPASPATPTSGERVTQN